MLKKFIILISLSTIIGCSSGQADQSNETVLIQDWETIEASAKTSDVNLYMWGGDQGINRYIDEWVSPLLKKNYGIQLNRYPMDASEFIQKLYTEKQAEQKKGDMDIIWINGENFKTAKENDLLLGPITSKLPNFNQYINPENPDIKLDFGYPTEGYEAPWGKVQFVFAYDSAKIKNPPTSIAELSQWVKEHPGKFTYPAPPDFTGSAFIRHVLYEVGENTENYNKPFDPSVISKDAEKAWQVLNEMEPFLWREGKSYPESLAQLEQLFKNEEIWLTMGYDEANASNLMKNGEFPQTTKTFVLENGTLANTHFLAVPFNAPHVEAALVTINELLSPEAQMKKMELTYWGENTALDYDLLEKDIQKKIDQIDRGPATLSQEELSEHRLPELDSEYVEWLEKGWIEHVAN